MIESCVRLDFNFEDLFVTIAWVTFYLVETPSFSWGGLVFLYAHVFFHFFSIKVVLSKEILP